jgi:hypothetical protein
VFGLANAPVSTSSCTTVDAYRLKRDFGYWLLSYCKQDFDTFSKNSKAVVEHHFNNHAHCDVSWCPMKNSDPVMAARGNLKYRCKKKNAKFYEQICDVMARFTTYEKLKECHHRYSSQKNESMNRHISRYVPKDVTYSQSMSLTARVSLAVGIDSVGHEDYYKQVFEELNIELPKNTRMSLQAMSRKREFDQSYQALPKRKRKRSELKFAKTKEGLRKQMADKAIGRDYDTGLNMGLLNDPQGEKAPRSEKFSCIFCGVPGHKTRRSKSCKYFGWAKSKVEAEMVSLNVSKATGLAVGAATVPHSSIVQSEGKCDYFGNKCDAQNMYYFWYSFDAHVLRRGI